MICFLKLTSFDPKLTFSFKRRLFPIKNTYSITIAIKSPGLISAKNPEIENLILRYREFNSKIKKYPVTEDVFTKKFIFFSFGPIALKL